MKLSREALYSAPRQLLDKKLHLSWLIASGAGGAIVGIGLVRTLGHELFIQPHLFVIALLLLFMGMLRRSWLALLIVCSAGMIIGLHTGAKTIQKLEPIRNLTGDIVTVTGVVRDDTSTGPSGDTRLRLNNVRINDYSVPGQLWVSAQNESIITRSDQITLEGELAPGFGSLQGAVFRARITEIIRPQPGDITRRIRDAFSQNVAQLIPSPEASVGVSFLVGQRTSLPPEIQDAFRNIGIIHLVVASGFHLSIVVGFSKKLFSRHSAYLTLFGGLSLIWFFLLLTGFSTSMVRAALVTSLSLLAWYVGRTIHPVVLLLVVAALTALINPFFVWGDVGWYLSFSAFAGVIILAPLVHAYLWGSEVKPGFFRYLIIATLSAQIATFPVIAYTFSEYSNVALLANTLILPIVPPIMLGVFISGAMGFISTAVAQIIATPVSWALHYVTFVAERISMWPLATSSLELSLTGVILCYAGIIAGAIILRVITGHSLRNENAVDFM